MTLIDEPTTRLAPEPTRDATTDLTTHWIDICSIDDLDVDRGVGALVEGEPVAIFRCSPWDELFAIGNIDPYSAASVLSRGIVGSIGHRRVVASPVFKNRFDLHTGRSIDDPTVAVSTYPIRVVRGRVQIAARAT
jgi:nitrite reductase (NADH) small subunit